MIRSYMWIFAITASMVFCQDSDMQITNVRINRGTYLTFRRYYFISRLEKTMNLLLQIQSDHRQPLRMLRSNTFDISTFHDKRIIRSLKRIEELRSLKPLFIIWDDFIAYKSLEDDIFIEDFSKEIFVVTRKVLSSLNENDKNSCPPFNDCANASPAKTEQLLDAIDQVTNILEQAVPSQCVGKNNPPTFRRTIPIDLKSEVSTDEIALRFYYIQRLQKAMEMLEKAERANLYRSINCDGLFKAVGVASLLRAMQEIGGPSPVLNQWNDIKEYKLIDNIKFIKEFASVVLITLRHIYVNPGESLVGGPHVENMSIDQILHAIDIITDQVSHSSQVYGPKENNSLEEWFKEYWWTIPLTAGTIAVRLAYYYYHSMNNPYGYHGGSFGGFGGFGGSNHGSSSSSESLNF